MIAIAVFSALLPMAPAVEGGASFDLASLAGRRVLVVPADETGAADADAVTQALQARGLVPVPPEARAGVDGVVVDVGAGDREKARTLLQEARARALALELDEARADGEAALAELLRLERPEDQRDLLVDTLLFLGALRMSSSDGGSGGSEDGPGPDALRLAARLEPERVELHPGLHRPRVVAAWQQARADNAAAASVFVVVAPRVLPAPGEAPAAVEIVVDGVVRVPDGGLLQLAEGPHLITLRARGAGSKSRIVVVTRAQGGQTPPINDTLAPVSAAARRREAAVRVRDGDEAAFAELQTLAEADVVVALSSGGRPRARAVTGVVDVDADPRDVAAFARAVLVALAPAVVDEQPPPESPWVAPLTIGLPIVVGGAIVGVAGTIIWQVFPGPDIAPPPRPVQGACCQL